MKVMIVGSDVGMSGAGLSMIKLADELEKRNIEVVRVVRKGNTEKILSEKNIDHYIVNAQSWIVPLRMSKIKKYIYIIVKKFLNIKCYFQYCKIIKCEEPDIIHINAITTYVAAKAALKYDKPIVWHIRELLEEDLGGEFWNKKRAYQLLEKSTEIIAISECVKGKYHKLLPNNSITRIYNGIDMKQYYNPYHKIMENDRITVTMAGRITKNKGQYQCLYEMRNVLKNNRNIVLCFAGTGEKLEVERIKRLILEEQINAEQVVFMGYVTDMYKLWSITDIAVIYSKCEAFGRVTVEAMAAGALVVGYDSGCTCELIQNGKNGLLFGKSVDSTLDSTIQKIIDDRQLAKRISEAGRDAAKTLYTAENNAKLVEGIYRSIMKRSDLT